MVLFFFFKVYLILFIFWLHHVEFRDLISPGLNLCPLPWEFRVLTTGEDSGIKYLLMTFFWIIFWCCPQLAPQMTSFTSGCPKSQPRALGELPSSPLMRVDPLPPDCWYLSKGAHPRTSWVLLDSRGTGKGHSSAGQKLHGAPAPLPCPAGIAEWESWGRE